MKKLIININYQIDEKQIADSINEAISLTDNEQMFEQLCLIQKSKKELQDLLELIEKHEVVAKGLINSKAKQLFGQDWQTIVSQKYKITRSSTGPVYVRNPEIKVNKKFIELKESLLTKEIDKYIEEKPKLPIGIEINPKRGESIRITLKI